MAPRDTPSNASQPIPRRVKASGYPGSYVLARPSPSVIVIGSGFAGLAAARTLADAGVQVSSMGFFFVRAGHFCLPCMILYYCESSFVAGVRNRSCTFILSVSCSVFTLALTIFMYPLACCPQVTVLESRDRIGGRAHTDYSFGFPVDLGAAWYGHNCQVSEIRSYAHPVLVHWCTRTHSSPCPPMH